MPVANAIVKKGMGSPVRKQNLGIRTEKRSDNSLPFLLFCRGFSSSLVSSTPLLDLESLLFVKTVIFHGLPSKRDLN